MKVVHVVPYYQEGLGYEENNLGFAQAALGLDVALVTSNRPIVNWDAMQQSTIQPRVDGLNRVLRAERYIDRGVAIRRLSPLLELRHPPQMLLRRLRDTLAEESPDIVNIHNPAGLLAVQTLMAARKLKLRVVIDSHLFYANLAPYHPGKQLYYRAFKRAVHPYFRQQIRRYLPHHPEAATLLGRELGVPVALMTQITLGTDIERFHFDPGSRTRIRDEMGLPPDAVVAIFVGRLTHDKDIDVLLRAATPLLPEHNLWLLCVGPVEDQHRRRLFSIVPEQFQARVRFTEYVRNEALPAYYSAADVGVWPGVAAISIIDALACGLPVIISRSEVTRHLISADNGICFTRGNVDELRRGLEAIISDGALRRGMGARSRGLAERVFAWERVAARTIEVYQAVLEGRPVEVAPLWAEAGATSPPVPLSEFGEGEPWA